MKKRSMLFASFTAIALFSTTSFADEFAVSLKAKEGCVAKGGSHGGSGSGGSLRITGLDALAGETGWYGSNGKAPCGGMAMPGSFSMPSSLFLPKGLQPITQKEAEKSAEDIAIIDVNRDEYREIVYQGVDAGSLDIGHTRLEILSIDVANKMLRASNGQKELIIRQQADDASDAVKSIFEMDKEELMIEQ